MIYKVKELIAELSKYDPESYVGYKNRDDGYPFITAIGNVIEREVEPEEMGPGFKPCLCRMVVIDD